MKSKKHLLILFLAFVLSLVIWNIPIARFILYPFQIFATFIHEFGHSFMAIITGGGVHSIKLFFNGAGLAYTSGGIRLFVVPGGYLGCSIIGGILLYLSASKNEKVPRFVIGVILFIMIVCLIFLVRDIFTLLIMLFFIAISTGIMLKANDFICQLFLGFLSLQCSFYALYDIKYLLFNSSVGLSQGGEVIKNDALVMQEMTFIPSIIWSFLWLLLSFIIFGFVLKLIYSDTFQQNQIKKGD